MGLAYPPPTPLLLRGGCVPKATAAVLPPLLGLTPGGVRRYCVGDVAGEPGGVPKRGVDAYDRQDTEALLSDLAPDVERINNDFPSLIT